MKKTSAMRVAVILMALTMITSCFVGGTFAKYTSTTSGSDTATVAKWDIKVEGTQIAVVGDPATVAVNLFDTINDSDGSEEADVADTLIAPGTSGSFALDITNDSEVTATYAIAFKTTVEGVTGEGVTAPPIQYRLSETADWSDTIPAVDATTIAMSGGTATVTVYWRWAFGDSANNANDTALGILAQTAAPTITVTATLTVNQVD